MTGSGTGNGGGVSNASSLADAPLKAKMFALDYKQPTHTRSTSHNQQPVT